ncbi:MAG: hypothetical protein J6K25_09670, partial [Thermoguttaceae bacterium]|nr:hypothetical protein [Thermoguttaceae bacterium]
AASAKKRVPLGRRAQAILTPYLVEKADDPDAFLFSPRDAARDRAFERRQRRKTPLTPSQAARDAAPKTRRYNDFYAENLYCKIIAKGAESSVGRRIDCGTCTRRKSARSSVSKRRKLCSDTPAPT